MNETDWYLGLREKLAANRLAKWLADKRQIIERIDNPELRKEIAKEMSGYATDAAGINKFDAINTRRKNIADYLTREQHAEKYPALFGSEEAADEWLRSKMRPLEPYDPGSRWQSDYSVDPLSRPLGGIGRSRTDEHLFRRTTRGPTKPLWTLQDAEEGMGLARPPARASTPPTEAVMEAANIPKAPGASWGVPFNFMSDAQVNKLIAEDAARYAAR